jgi:hypothetical protein
MPADTRVSGAGKLAVLVVAAATLTIVLMPRAWAGSQPYLGWDFGAGISVGIGTPPSAYDPCPTYGWPVYPYQCRYYYYRHARHARHARHYRRYY